jgi:hypothetical protein
MENKSNIGCVRLSHEEFYRIYKEACEKRKKEEKEYITFGNGILAKMEVLLPYTLEDVEKVLKYYGEK